MNSWDAAAQNRSAQLNNEDDVQTIGDSIELENLRRRDAKIQKEQDRRTGFVGYLKRVWKSLIAEKPTSELDSLDMYYLYSELEDLETPPRYRPDSVESLCKITHFTEAEIKRIYRGFKAECPTGFIKEETFKMIYAQFFPQGANSSPYAHYIFNTLDQDHIGLISFENVVQNFSILSRGSLEEKLRWVFALYDINGDGCITKQEMTDIVAAVYDLLGNMAEPSVEQDTVKNKVDGIFQKMDKNKDGVVTLDEFIECCQMDSAISSSMSVFESSI